MMMMMIMMMIMGKKFMVHLFDILRTVHRVIFL